MAEYVNPDAPNPEVVSEMFQRFRGGYQTGAGAPPSVYYPGGTYDPFGGSYASDSRSNIGPSYPPAPGYPYGQPTQPPVQSAPPFNGLVEQKNGYGMTSAPVDPTWTPPAQPQYGQPQYGVPYNGYPLRTEPGDYIYEYMRSHSQGKVTWGENYWTTPRPIDPPKIDWTPKPAPQAPAYPGDPYAGYGYNAYPAQVPYSQPQLPQNFAFPNRQETWLDEAQRNWKNL